MVSPTWTAILQAVLFLDRTVATSLQSVCTQRYVQSVLPAASTIEGLVVLPQSVTANSVTNYTVSPSEHNLGKDGLAFCNVTLLYRHAGTSNNVRSHYPGAR